MTIRKIDDISERVESAAEAVAVEPSSSGARLRLFGAYTLLFIWGATYLVLFFTDRLPF